MFRRAVPFALAVSSTLAVSTVSCVTLGPEARVDVGSRSRPLEFRFVSPDGQTLDSRELRGRATLVLLITSYDVASQLMARRANQLLHEFRPRINVGAILVEPPQYAELLETFRQTLELSYPVVMGDHALLEGRGPFGELLRLPTAIVLDRQGREVSRWLGAATSAELEEGLRRALE